MAQNLTIAGASYSDVPAVNIAKTGGGIATFTDVSDSTVTPETLLEGEKAYNAAGELITGTAKAGGGGGVTNETCEVTISGSNSSYSPANVAYTSVDDSGKIIGVNQTVSTSSVTVTCVKGSTLAVKFKRSLNVTNAFTNVSLLFYTSPLAVFKLDDNATKVTIANTSTSISGGSV